MLAVRRLRAVVAALVALYLALIAGQRAIDGYRAKQEVAAVTREIEGLRVENRLLQEEISDVRRDSEIERIARSELGLVKPGDRPVVLTWPEGSEGGGNAPTARSSQEEANWRQWLRLFVDLE